jgi:2-polyprenyl-3-methyl-5-hydroxy-6-metoxy-1,4-benzoquinol methylase
VTSLGFYEELSRVYDIVFKKDEATSNFLKKELGAKSEILDLACGTGTYSMELAKEGHNVIGLDLDKDMIEQAKVKANNNSVELYCEDMLSFKKITKDKLFDRIFCIGNSLVHLKDRTEIRQFIEAIYHSLKKDGCMIIQIINYDRIIDNNVKSLPTIDRSNEGVKFIRNYTTNKDKGTLNFETELIINNNGQEKVYTNSVPLLALRSEEIIEILEAVNFSKFELYGSFNEADFDINAYALVIKGYRQ